VRNPNRRVRNAKESWIGKGLPIATALRTLLGRLGLGKADESRIQWACA